MTALTTPLTFLPPSPFCFGADYYKKIPALTVIFTLIPPAPLAKGAIDLGLAADRGGISFSRRSAYCQNVKDPSTADALYAANKGYYLDTSCVFPLGTILSVLAVEFFVYVLIGIYLDNVVADSNGVKKKPWYLLSPVYWCGGMRRRGSARRKLRPPVACPVESGEADVDVAAEEAAMKELILHRTGTAGALAAAEAVGGGAAKNAVEVFGLQKVFGRGWFAGCCGSCCGGIKWFLCCCGCCSCCRRSGRRTQPKRSREFWAIKGSWFSIRRDQLFCLLGPNGAGKTTTINCLTGVLPPSGGDALVYGESINAPGGLDRIRAVMGVCPQFDVQWAELTGAEHLFIYGRVKGLSRKNVAAQSAELLESVKLTAAKDQRTGQYSGGMRRRLSVAIALLGDPLVVYLDEPTTGMDPISRRHVWDAIEAAKPGRAIVLTTHSMEEADILGDTIAIMARGKLRAYGSSLRLKQRFGSGYQISVAVSGAPSADAVKAAFAEELGVSIVEDATGHYLVFHVPKAQEAALPAFLKRLEAKSAELGIVDLQISLTSLEEVFLNIARKAELEAAAAEGRSDVAVTLEDGTALDVPLGAEEAVQESTGRRYAIKWAQDEEGSLQVLSWTLLASNGPAAVAPAPENGMARGT